MAASEWAGVIGKRGRLGGLGVGGCNMSIVPRVRRLFLTGLVVVVPLWGTVLILTTLFNTLDRALANLLGPRVSSSIPGLGLVMLLLLILIAGVLASNFLGGRALKASETALLRVPVVRAIYATSTSLTD